MRVACCIGVGRLSIIIPFSVSNARRDKISCRAKGNAVGPRIRCLPFPLTPFIRSERDPMDILHAARIPFAMTKPAVSTLSVGVEQQVLTPKAFIPPVPIRSQALSNRSVLAAAMLPLMAGRTIRLDHRHACILG